MTGRSAFVRQAGTFDPAALLGPGQQDVETCPRSARTALMLQNRRGASAQRRELLVIVLNALLILIPLGALCGGLPPDTTVPFAPPRQDPPSQIPPDETVIRQLFHLDTPRPAGYRPYRWGQDRKDLPIRPAAVLSAVLEVDASSPIGPYQPIADEINVGKAYALFAPGNRTPERFGPGGLRSVAPWWRWARIPAALGGNFCPETANACRRRRRSEAHDLEPGWECGTPDGEPGPAERYEPVRVAADGSVSLDFSYIRRCFAEIRRAGLLPHVNISSAHSQFTGHDCLMHWYHWNEQPVVDLAGWQGFVETALRSFQRSDLPDWRFSIVNEPNCITFEKGAVRKVGYRGSPEQYARQFVATAEAIRRVRPDACLQAGNYVIATSDKLIPRNNLHRYLAALAAELDRSETLSWDDLSYYSFSVYDTPHESIYAADASKFRILEEFRRLAGLSRLPLKIDEYEIHPEVHKAFDDSHRWPYQYTWHSASWTAKALRVFHHHGVYSAAGWLTEVFRFPNAGGKATPLPKYYVYLMDNLLAGSIDVDPGGRFPAVRSLTSREQAGACEEVSVTGQVIPEHLGEGYGYRSIEATATRDNGGQRLRILLFYHSTILLSDEETLSEPMAVPTTLRVQGLARGRYRLRVYGIGPCLEDTDLEQRWIRWEGSRRSSRPFVPLCETEVEVGQGPLTVDPEGNDGRFLLGRHSVVFVDLMRVSPK